jgi:hypothetical protein
MSLSLGLSALSLEGSTYVVDKVIKERKIATCHLLVAFNDIKGYSLL